MRTPTGEYDPEQVKGSNPAWHISLPLASLQGQNKLPQLSAVADCVSVSPIQW